MDTEQPTVPYGHCHCGCGQKTRISAYSDKRYGHVRGEPTRYLRGHQFRGVRKTTRWIEEDRGYGTPCWIWQLFTDAKGYGFDGHGHRTRDGGRYAHRIMWERVNGPIPEGLQLDHLCRVPSCVNPDHLEPVTPGENTRRGVQTKLSHEQVAEIRAAYAAGGVTHRELGARYGVSHNRIGHIVRGQAWTTA